MAAAALLTAACSLLASRKLHVPTGLAEEAGLVLLPREARGILPLLLALEAEEEEDARWSWLQKK